MPGCGDFMHPDASKDVMGNIVGCFINGTDEDVGIVNMTTQAGDYTAANMNSPDGLFRIAVEVAGVIEVELADGTDFTITAVMAGAYVGRWMELNIRKVYKSGTAGTFLVGW
jgi:hypothetical protein